MKRKKAFSPTILRFATDFGFSNRMRYDLTINQFTKDLYLKRYLEIYDFNTWRPYCHVKDFARLIEIIIFSKKDLIIIKFLMQVVIKIIIPRNQSELRLKN